VKNLIPHVIHRHFREGKRQGSFQAYTMFIDLSGFTALTEELMKQGTEGAEQLSYSLNAIFAPMIELVYQRGACIPYFAGDAFTVIFDEDNTLDPRLHMLQTAQEVVALFAKKGLSQTIYGNVTIGIKIGLSYGRVDWGIVGGDYKSYFFRGPAIDQSAASEHLASNRDIILDEAILQRLPQKIYPEVVRPDFYRLIDAVEKNPSIEGLNAFEGEDMSANVLGHFLPKEIYEGNEIGEFRNVISVFISFEGLERAADFDQFARIVLNLFSRYAGYFKEIDFGDKGGLMLGIFGAPVSYENNIERALEFVLGLKEELEGLQEYTSLRYRIGITSGIAFTGIIGGRERCQYAAVGTPVNLAARMAMAADWGEVLVGQEIRKAREFRFVHKGDFVYKGLWGAIPTYELTGRGSFLEPNYKGDLVGREEELAQLLTLSSKLKEGSFAGLAYVYGEAGIGKSRLIYEFQVKLKQQLNVSWLTCQADQILRKPFNPFIYLLRNYFDQQAERTEEENLKSFNQQFERLAAALKGTRHASAPAVLRELQRLYSVLAALINLKTDDSLWDQLDARGRYENALNAFTVLILANAMIQPLVLELEDGHWFDESSQSFLNDLIRQLRPYPVLIIITSRYRDDGSRPQLINQDALKASQIELIQVDLGSLGKKPLLAFTQSHLDGPTSPELLDLLYRTANGNPFYAEQILEYFIESDLLVLEESGWNIRDKNVRVSDSINSILMARIDRLSSLVKETVKAAAVIGREFDLPVLAEVMRQHEEMRKANGNLVSILRQQVVTAERVQIWRAVNELRYIFKHSLLREAVYDMQLHTKLRQIHLAIAQAIEKLYADQLEGRYVDLVFHYKQAEVKEKIVEYLEKAGDYAKANFQNQQALEFYEELSYELKDSPPTPKLCKVLLKKGTVLELIGRWQQCQKVYEQALELAEALNSPLLLGRAYHDLGHLLILQGNYADARPYLNTAIESFTKAKDFFGLIKANGSLGNLFFRQGQYDEAKKYLSHSIRLKNEQLDHLPSPQLVSNLGLTFMNQGKYKEAIAVMEEELAFCESDNHKVGMAIINVNLGIILYESGDYDRALECYQVGLELSEELSNKLLITIAIGCIGSVYQQKGDFERAMEHFERDLKFCEELGDKQGIAIAHGLIGELRAVEGKFAIAKAHLMESLRGCEQLGYQKGIAKAKNNLGDIAALEQLPDDAIRFYEEAIQICRQINNLQILAFSLVEQGDVYQSRQQLPEAKACQQEALEIARQINHPEILFLAQVLRIRLQALEGAFDEAIGAFKQLLEQTEKLDHRAEILSDLFHLTQESEYREQAWTLFKQLYQQNPKMVFQLKINELESVD